MILYVPDGALCSVHPGARGAVAVAEGVCVDRNIFRILKLFYHWNVLLMDEWK